MSKEDAKKVVDKTTAKKSHHDGVDEREVARWVKLSLLLTTKPNMTRISSWGILLHQM